tara:strand:+ start:16 stop:276 length:261 start_codon:yes stop_codon:yes gene_type:complete
MGKVKLIISDDLSKNNSSNTIYFSNSRWNTNSAKLEGCEFGDVIVRCKIDDSFQKWLLMHLGIRIDRIVYEGRNPWESDTVRDELD